MRLLFWNVQRLGGGSPELKKALIEGVMAEVFKLDVEWVLLCEMTSDTEFGDVPIQKQLAVGKQTARKSTAQLGYSWIRNDLTVGDLQVQMIDPMQVYAPSGENVRLCKGGSYFHKLSKRNVVYVGQDQAPVGVNIFMYHANSSYKSPRLVTQVVSTCVYDTIGTGDLGFLLVGDLNCEPDTLLPWLDVNLEPEVRATVDVTWGGPTHNARDGATSVLDYCVHSRHLTCEVKTVPLDGVMQNVGRKNFPDHLPILVGIGESLVNTF